MTDPGQILRQEIQKNFPQFGSIRTLVTYQAEQPEDQPYDADTGVVGPDPDPPASFTVHMIFSAITAAQAAAKPDDPVQAKDQKALVPALDMKVVPLIDDHIITPDGVLWVVKSVRYDPAAATYTMWIRPRVG